MIKESDDPAGLGPSVKPGAVYHHGDLRSALIAAAREALETNAPETVTLKSLATRLGVSQPAPYRHFEGRDALLSAVAVDGFERFAEALNTAASAGPAAQAFERSCLAYVEFGLGNIGVYRLMFASNLVAAALVEDPLTQVSRSSFQALVDAVSRHVGSTPATATATATAMSIWSTLHGVVMLSAQGLFSGPLMEGVQAIDAVHALIASHSSGPRDD